EGVGIVTRNLLDSSSGKGGDPDWSGLPAAIPLPSSLPLRYRNVGDPRTIRRKRTLLCHGKRQLRRKPALDRSGKKPVKIREAVSRGTEKHLFAVRRPAHGIVIAGM